MPPVLSIITIVIRSADERTEKICKNLILEQGVNPEALFIVKEAPFSRAMRRSFEIGIKENRKWTLCIDADVLLRPGSIKKLIGFAEKQKSNVCEIQGFVMDKFFGGPRQAGNHLYRTSLLKKVITCIPEEGVNIRPENHTLEKMAEIGYKWKSVPVIVGLHDHEQYNFDIFRKAFVHGIKHLDRAELLVTHWKEKAEEEPDFIVALKAFSDSIQFRDKAYINRDQVVYHQKFLETDFEEKTSLSIESINSNEVESIIKNWKYSSLYYYYFPDRDGLDSKGKASLIKVKRNIRRIGLLKTTRLIIGEILLNAGKSIKGS